MMNKQLDCSYFVLFDDASNQQSILLEDYVACDTIDAYHLHELDEKLEKGWQHGWHVAVFADYEFGLILQKLPVNPHFSGSLRLYWFEKKKKLSDAASLLNAWNDGTMSGISTPVMDIDEHQYQQNIQRIHEAIRCGDTYQINYTVRLHLQVYGSPINLYRRLRQSVPYGVLAKLPENEWILCFSPELFLRIDETGMIQTEPMKGTAPRLGDDDDELQAKHLKNDPKNRAENIMIVDLLRNDLGKMATIGGVNVPEPFKVSAFGNVWQMTSVVEAKLRSGLSVADVFQAAFPCGSITGAPKRKSMEWIQKLERDKRGLYTGTIGFLEPKPNSFLGWSGCLNVVIRTLQLFAEPNSMLYRGTYGVGSGIVIDSMATEEFAECGWKSRFIRELRPECGLFETMRVEEGKIQRLNAHFQRLKQSADALNIPLNMQEVAYSVQSNLEVLDPQNIYRMKLMLSPQGCLKIETSVLNDIGDTVDICISDWIAPEFDYLRRHKIDRRKHLDQVWQQAEQQSCFDALIFNERGILLEGGRSSIMIEENEKKWVVAGHLDILNSLIRQEALNHGAKEAEIDLQRLVNAKQIWVGNALRGWLKAHLICPSSS